MTDAQLDRARSYEIQCLWGLAAKYLRLTVAALASTPGELAARDRANLTARAEACEAAQRLLDTPLVGWR